MPKSSLVVLLALSATTALWWWGIGQEDSAPAAVGETGRLHRIGQAEPGQAKEARWAGSDRLALEAASSATPADSFDLPEGSNASGDPEHPAWIAQRRHSRRIVRDATQTEDPGLVQQALAELRLLLASESPGDQLVALQALPQLRELEYDKASMRGLVEPCLHGEDEDVRAASLFALLATDPRPEDVHRLGAMVHDVSPKVREELASAIMLLTNRNLTGRAGESVLALLHDPSAPVRGRVLSSLSGATIGHDLEVALIGLAHSPDSRRDAIHFGLSTLADKSVPVVGVLLAAVEAGGEVGKRALWGLQTGVSQASHPRVTRTAVRLLGVRTDYRSRQSLIDLVAQYGTAADVPAMRAFAERCRHQPSLHEQTMDAIGRLSHR